MSDARLEMDVEAAIARALAAFAAGCWRQALDDFEVPYHRASGTERNLWLGLVRAAGALHHRESGRDASFRHLLRLAGEALRDVADDAAGLDLATFKQDLGLVNGVAVVARPRLIRHDAACSA